MPHDCCDLKDMSKTLKIGSSFTVVVNIESSGTTGDREKHFQNIYIYLFINITKIPDFRNSVDKDCAPLYKQLILSKNIAD